MSLSARESAMCSTLGIEPAEYEAARDVYRDERGFYRLTLTQGDTLRRLAPTVPRRTIRRWCRGRSVLDVWAIALEQGIASTVPAIEGP